MNLRKHRLNITGCGLAAFLCLCAATGPAKDKSKHDDAKLSPPAFSPKGGVFSGNVSLQLSASGQEIHYTTDGSEPTAYSPVYSSAFLVTNSTLVRARSFSAQGQASAASSATYTLLDADLANFTSNLPLVVIDSFGTNIVHDYGVQAGFQFFDTGSGRANFKAAPSYSGYGLVHIRGRASLRYPKNSFTLKLLDGDGDPEAASLLGFPAESDWILYAPYPDKTLMRDVLAYELHAEMGHWASRTKFVEVFVQHLGTKIRRQDYAGVFVFEEKIKRDKNRVDISKLKPEDASEPRISGGYIFKKDHVGNVGLAIQGDPLGGFPAFVGGGTGPRIGYPTGPGGFPADPAGFPKPSRSGSRSSQSYSGSSSSRPRTIRGPLTNYVGRPQPQLYASLNRDTVYRSDDGSPEEESFKTSRTNEFFFVEPDITQITAVQKAWLKNYLNNFEAALYGPDFKDPAKGYAAYIDPDSFIDYHIITELSKNVDGFRFSVFFHKDRGGKIKAEPIWDWNLSFGNANGKQGWLPQWWLWPQLDDKEYTWYRRLFEDSDFGQKYVDRWALLRTNILATEKVLARVDKYSSLVGESQKRNFERWPIIGRPVNPNYFVGSSYDEEIQFMKNFIRQRLDWIDQQFLPVPRPSGSPGRSLSLVTGRGQILYTLDGTDPRSTGGLPAASARTYSTPVQLANDAKLFARARLNDRWSAPLLL
ncbi:MAG TPA: CotH kinase family protein, partial [Verrucomicrobiae bacterium]